MKYIPQLILLQMVRIITSLFFLGCLFSPTWAQECQNPIVSYRHHNGCTFTICKAAFIPFPNNLKQSVPPQEQPTDAFLIKLEIINHTSFKKVDLTNQYTFYLNDNFFNKYMLLDISDKSGREITIRKHSLYPRESIEHILIFETPIDKFQELILSIDSIEPGMNNPIHLAIPKEKIIIDDKELLSKQIGSYEMEIITPAQNTLVQPDTVIPLQLAFADDVPLPSSIYIISKDYVLEDPKSSLRYDIRIPHLSQEEPFTIHIIAKWSVNNETYHISKTLFLRVTNPTKNCLLDCIKANQ